MDETRKGVLTRMIGPSLKPAEAAVTPVRMEEGWWETVKVIIEALLIALVVRTVLFQPFNIPLKDRWCRRCPRRRLSVCL